MICKMRFVSPLILCNVCLWHSLLVVVSFLHRGGFCEALRRPELMDLLLRNQHGHMDSKVREQVRTSLIEYAHSDPKCDRNDVLFEIGKIYGVSIDDLEEPASENGQEEPIVSFDFMREFIEDVFKSYGVSDDHAKVAADVLVEADMRGIDSHGLGRLKPIYCDRFDQGILFPEKPIDIVKETDTTALVDANLGLGLYVGPYCMQLAIDKAKRHGVGFVVVRNSTHYGIAGYYTGMAADQGCVGFTGTNARPSIAPTFGAESVLGTNPICFGMPSSDPFPFIIDCASSITQRGTIERYEREGKPTPRGCVLDIQGIERTDTEGILVDLVKRNCFLTPIGGAGEALGGYKGYGWATTIELLCTAFQSGPIGEELSGIDKATGKPKPMPLGHFFLAIDIEPLCSLDVFKENVGRLLKTLRSVKKLPGHNRVWTAGEKEYDARMERLAQGGMFVSKPLQRNMMELRDDRPTLKKKYAKFPFE